MLKRLWTYYTFSERQKEQLIWSRCINTTGHPGANILCDLFMEHLNRRLKMVIRSMGANSPSSIQRAGKAIASVQCAKPLNGRQPLWLPPLPLIWQGLWVGFRTSKARQGVPSYFYTKAQFKCGLMEQANRKNLLKKVENTINQLIWLWLLEQNMR